jgi:hypothetical protein
MTKTLYTLNIDNYSSDITDLTYPLLRAYAKKIGAEFHVIDTRRWPRMPPVYEKLQIFELGAKSDWNIYIDSDALVHPDFFDPTDHLSKDTVAHNGADMAGNRWRYDRYFRRDGRHIGSCNWFTVGSDWCLDLWHPLNDQTPEEAYAHIRPTLEECKAGISTEHLIDDYVLSRNIARYGLKFTTVSRMLKELDDTGNYLWHQYLLKTEEKVEELRGVMKSWKLL